MDRVTSMILRKYLNLQLWQKLNYKIITITDDMNLTFLIAGLGFVAVAGVLYYFTSKAEEEEVEVRKEEATVASAPAHEVNK